MTTAVGFDAQTASASLRAGIARLSELNYFDYFLEAGSEPVLLSGHVAAPHAVEAEGLGKMVGLGMVALNDLFHSGSLPNKGSDERTGFYLALPNYSLRQKEFFDVDRAIASGDATRLVCNEWEGEDDEDPMLSLRFAVACEQHLVAHLIHATGLDLNILIRRNTYGDQCAFLTALRHAMNDLSAGKLDRAIVGGIDSFLDPLSLEWAGENHRLKDQGNPHGFSPGEAAVFLDLRLQGRLASGGQEPGPGLLIGIPEWGEEPGHLRSDNPPLGKGLAAAIELALSGSRVTSLNLVIGDLNGEPHRSQDWGYAVHRLLPQFPFLAGARTWFPAESFGETGCASTGLAIGVGIQGLKRGYANSDSVLIWCSSETSRRGALVLVRSGQSHTHSRQ